MFDRSKIMQGHIIECFDSISDAAKAFRKDDYEDMLVELEAARRAIDLAIFGLKEIIKERSKAE